MRRLVVSTDDVPEAERFSYWREAVGQGLIGASVEPNKGRQTPCNASLSASIGASVTRIHYRSSGNPVFRRTRDIARRDWDDQICLYQEASVGAWFEHDRREFVTRPDDLVKLNPSIPLANESRRNCHHTIWLFPRQLFDPHLRISHQRSLVLTGRDGLSGMVKAYLDAFGAQIDALDDRDAGFIADNFCRLLAVACGGSAGEQREATRLARLEEAKRYINLHLADYGLTPEKAAATLKVSLRQLHLLFEPSGTSFAQYVLRRRLEECRAALANPIGDRSVTDIAFGWGFNSLATFNRTFRQAFAATPSDLRAHASRPG